jgi:hypothetical protein
MQNWPRAEASFGEATAAATLPAGRLPHSTKIVRAVSRREIPTLEKRAWGTLKCSQLAAPRSAEGAANFRSVGRDLRCDAKSTSAPFARPMRRRAGSDATRSECGTRKGSESPTVETADGGILRRARRRAQHAVPPRPTGEKPTLRNRAWGTRKRSHPQIPTAWLRRMAGRRSRGWCRRGDWRVRARGWCPRRRVGCLRRKRRRCIPCPQQNKQSDMSWAWR